MASAAAAGGMPDAGSRIGQDLAGPAARPAAPPKLNLELVRPRGAELSRHSASGLFPVLPRPPELKSKLARDIEQAGQTDCRNAYSAMGLAAAVPLLRDALRADGCRW